jgi:hypothetical protein
LQPTLIPDTPIGTLLSQGQALAAEGHTEEARACFYQALALNPWDQAAHLALTKLDWTDAIRAEVAKDLAELQALPREKVTLSALRVLRQDDPAAYYRLMDKVHQVARERLDADRIEQAERQAAYLARRRAGQSGNQAAIGSEAINE